MLNDRIFRGGGEFPDVLKPSFGNAPFAFVVAQLRWRGAGAVLVEENQAVKETAWVNLAECFFRGVVGKLLKQSSVGFFRAVVMLLTCPDFPIGSLVEIFEIKPASPCCLAGEDHCRLHRMSSKYSRTRSSLVSMR